MYVLNITSWYIVPLKHSQQECPEEPACLAYGDCVVCQFGTQGSGDRNCNRKCNITTLGAALPPGQSFNRDSYMINGSKLLMYHKL